MSMTTETKAEQLLASLVDPGMANNTGNPEWIRRLELVSDTRLDEVSETAWYLAADPHQHDTIVRAYLVGEPRPCLEENSEFERDAIGHKCQLDFGVGVIDYRGPPASSCDWAESAARNATPNLQRSFILSAACF